MAISGGYHKYLQLTDIAFRMIATIALGFFLGHKLDAYLDLWQKPWMTIVFGLAAVAAAIYQVVARLNQLDKK
jgi:F0F1-type ATP synthase assembly protein I